MTNEKFNEVINSFLEDFNQMCTTERKDFLLRERMVNYESGPAVKRYNVTHRVRQRGNVWTIEAVSRGFWIFRRRFFLFKITKKENTASLFGLYTGNVQDFDVSQLEEKLNAYLKKCKSLPRNAFVKS